MGTKDPEDKQSFIQLDSDSEIIDVDLSIITIPDSSDMSQLAQSDAENITKISEFDQENLLFEVKFKSADVFNELRELLMSGLRETLKDQTGITIVEDDEAIQVFRTTVDEDIDISGLFMVDTQPTEKVDVVQIPSYKRTIKEILDDSSTKKKKKSEDDCERPRISKCCFNCGGIDHDLRTCPKPRNNSKINKAKKLRLFRHDRYHVDIEQRFAHLRPGKVSKNLREALGIRGGELPFFFYRMRVLGYPPGWLEDAKVAHSGISLFDSEGRTVRDPDEEEGETDVEKHKYDVSKIIAFPGFNLDPGPHFYDDHRHHNVPPLNPENFRDQFIKTLGDNVVKGYKRKKLKDLPEPDAIEKPKVEVSEMDIEIEENTSIVNVEFTRPPPPPTPPREQSPPPLPAQPSPPHRSPSPSLEDLEARQKRLLQELQANVTITSDNDDSLIDDVIELEADSISATPTLTKIDPTGACPTESDKEDSQSTNGSPAPLPQTPQTPAALAMESVLGTPLLKFSPFDKLPCGDNFKVGVSDVINFENLPDSTGTYEKMKGVIKKVRTVVTQLNSEDA